MKRGKNDSGGSHEEASSGHHHSGAKAKQGHEESPEARQTGKNPEASGEQQPPIAEVLPEQAGPQKPPPEETAKVDEKFLRLRADFENYRKRMLRERDELFRRANEDIIRELLPVLDHMELALESARAHGMQDSFMEGFRLVSDQLLDVLKKFGVAVIDAVGRPFDPATDEAVVQVPHAEVPANGIVSQVRRGYKLRERVLRPAGVVVSSGPVRSEGAGSGQPDSTAAGH